MMVIARIKQIRVEKNFTQEKLAKSAEIALRSLQYYESGKRKPPIDTIYKLAKALDVEVTDLFPMQEVESQ